MIQHESYPDGIVFIIAFPQLLFWELEASHGQSGII